MKNYTTPRTLADAEFTSGYTIVQRRQSPWSWGDAAIAVVAVAVLAAIAVGVL